MAAAIEALNQLRFITQFRPKGDASMTTSGARRPMLRRMFTVDRHTSDDRISIEQNARERTTP
jgi:hypothetical protein